MTNRQVHPLFVRTVPSYASEGAALAALMNELGWKSSAMIASNVDVYDDTSKAWLQLLAKRSVVVEPVKYLGKYLDAKYPNAGGLNTAAALDAVLASTSRVVLVLASLRATIRVAQEASARGMMAASWAWIGINTTDAHKPAGAADAEALAGWLFLWPELTVPTELQEALSKEPAHDAQQSSVSPDMHAVFLYNAILLYARAAAHTLSRRASSTECTANGGPHLGNGSALVQAMAELPFQDGRSAARIDADTGDVIVGYAVVNQLCVEGSLRAVRVGRYDGDGGMELRKSEITWPGGGPVPVSPIARRPDEVEDDDAKAIIGAVVSGVAFVVALALLVYYTRRYSRYVRRLLMSFFRHEALLLFDIAIEIFDIVGDAYNVRYSRDLQGYGLCSYGLDSYGLCGYGLHSYGLYSYGLHRYGPSGTRATYKVIAYIVMACIVMAYIVMAYISMAHQVLAQPEGEVRHVQRAARCVHGHHRASVPRLAHLCTRPAADAWRPAAAARRAGSSSPRDLPQEAEQRRARAGADARALARALRPGQGPTVVLRAQPAQRLCRP